LKYRKNLKSNTQLRNEPYIDNKHKKKKEKDP